MKKESVKQPEIKIVGFTARTNMQTEMVSLPFLVHHFSRQS